MIIGVAFCPHPPALVPELGRGTGDLDPLRAACRRSVGSLLAAGPELVVIVGSAAVTGWYDPPACGSLAGFGVPIEVTLGSGTPSDASGPVLPLSLTIGAWLLDSPPTGVAVRAVAVSPGQAASVAGELSQLSAAKRVGLLVMADGSARRTAQSPGYLDERAIPFDAQVEQALRTGDAATLRDLDETLGQRLWVAGVPAWRAVGSLLAGSRIEAELMDASSPYGVGYWSAFWTIVAAGPSPAQAP